MIDGLRLMFLRHRIPVAVLILNIMLVALLLMFALR